MTEEDLRRIAADQRKGIGCSCAYAYYRQWRRYDNVPEEWKSLGRLDSSEVAIKRNGYAAHPESSDNYWSEQQVIAIHYYPYHQC